VLCKKMYAPYSSLAVLDYPFEYSGEMLWAIKESSILKCCLLKKTNFKQLSFTDNSDNKVHLSIEEYESSGRNSSPIENFLNKTNSPWGVWNHSHPNKSIGNCIGGYKSKLVLVDCLEKLPFVCERY
jgi:hypothetical protein